MTFHIPLPIPNTTFMPMIPRTSYPSLSDLSDAANNLQEDLYMGTVATHGQLIIN